MKEYIEISRRWGKEKIEIKIFSQGETDDNKIISVSMDLADFAEALKKEVGSVTFTLTNAGFSKKIDAAIDNILIELKTATIQHANQIASDLL